LSYDLVVFDTTFPLSTYDDFILWYENQTISTVIEDYENPANLSDILYAWYTDMIKQFPPLNPPDFSREIDDSKLSEYIFHKQVVYVEFAWSQAEFAYKTVFKLAKKHKIGFYDLSSSKGDVWLPAKFGRYKRSFRINDS